jgi:hypothetical protein
MGAQNIDAHAFKMRLYCLDTKLVQIVNHGMIPSMIFLIYLMVFAQKQHCFGIDGIRDVKRLKLLLLKQGKWKIILNGYAKTFKSLGASFTKWIAKFRNSTSTMQKKYDFSPNKIALKALLIIFLLMVRYELLMQD